MRFVFDTYAWIEYFKGSATGTKVKRIVESEENEIFTSVMTIAELSSKLKRESDMELDYNNSTITYDWVKGYKNKVSDPYYLYNYGDAKGCPQNGTTSTPGACANGWTQENVSYVSYGSEFSYPFPEIYGTAGGNSKQWQQISLYTYLKYGKNMYIPGLLSQSQACAQRGCVGTDNTPDQAWSQLWTQLNSDTRTAQSLQYSTDIKWRK